MRLSLPNHGKAQPFVETPCGVDFDDLQFDRNTPTVGLVTQGPDQLRPDPPVLMVWSDFNDGEINTVFLPLDRDAADGDSIALNDLARGGIEMVAKALGLPLLVPAPRPLHVGPQGGTVQPPQEGVVILSRGPERDLHRYLRPTNRRSCW
jgi:hypothetical protein